MKNDSTKFFLQGNYAPLSQEINFENITSIIGEIPKELNGTLYRNGPNPQFPDERKHWFEGDGMLHMFSIRNGKVSYRNRWIQTERFKRERQAGKLLFRSFDGSQPPEVIDVSNTANTNIIQYAGKLLALEELSCATEINPANLNTLGNWTYCGQVPQMSAHPHFHPNGEMHNFAYSPESNEIVYYIFDHEGHVKHSQVIHAPFSSFMHDFFITESFALFPVHPLTFNMERIKQGSSVLMWEPDLGSHIGIIPHTCDTKDIVWFPLEAHYAFHYMNAYEDGHKIILDGMKSMRANLFPDAKGRIPSPEDFPPQLTRWIFDLKAKKIIEQQLDTIPAEFPRFDERNTGLQYRHGFVAARINQRSEAASLDSLIHYDLKKNTQTIRTFKEGSTVSEPVFVSRHKTSEEGDGFILTVVYVPEKNSSDLYILDAMNIDQEPLAIVQLPHRIPNGFHGNWYDD
jgi:carotenoid cleavage dioxygenase